MYLAKVFMPSLIISYITYIFESDLIYLDILRYPPLTLKNLSAYWVLDCWFNYSTIS